LRGEALLPGSSPTIDLVVAVGSDAYPTTTKSATVDYAADTYAANNVARRPTTIRLP
jgi:hypothetical protein